MPSTLASKQDGSLQAADLNGADLSRADLSEADLGGANLTDAIVTHHQLAQAKNLEDAILPDGTRHG